MGFGDDMNTEDCILTFQSTKIFVENLFDVLNWTGPWCHDVAEL